MKILVVGGPGSGKTVLAKRISQEYSLPHYEIDKMFYNNDLGEGTRRDETDRDELVAEAISEKQWVIEGAFSGSWTKKMYAQADRIIVLNISTTLRNYRIIKRYIKGKLGIEHRGRKESFKGLLELLTYSTTYNRKKYSEIMDHIQPYLDKTTIITKPQQIIAERMTERRTL